MSEQEEQSKLEGMCPHGNFATACKTCLNKLKAETEKELHFSVIDPEDLKAIEEYYQFEIDNGFAEPEPLEPKVRWRQKQMQSGGLKIVTAKEGQELIGTDVLVLENGTMKKVLKEDEAWAAGTVVAKDQRGKGIAKKLQLQTYELAKAAGKKSILTDITKNNFESMRASMQMGFEMESVDKREKETNYRYRKNLAQEGGILTDWPAEVLTGNLREFSGEITEQSPEQILIDPDNEEMVSQALENKYKGVFLIRPNDFQDSPPIEKNYLVFTK